MKTIKDYLTSKLRRAEVEHLLRLEFEGARHPQFGALEARLLSQSGHAEFFESGLCLSKNLFIPYSSIVSLRMKETNEGQSILDVLRAGDQITRIKGTTAGTRIVHDTLRWIKNTERKRLPLS